MNFWTFADQHPFVIVFSLLIICLALCEIASAIANAFKR